MKTILLTGATGFVGKHLVEKFSAEGYDIIALVRTTSDTSVISDIKNTRLYMIDENLEEVFRTNQINGVIHVATSYGINSKATEILEANLIFPTCLLELATKYNVDFFINTDTFFTKSAGEYSHLNSYTLSKTFFTTFFKTFSAKIKCVNLKLEHVYGRGDSEQKFVPMIIKRLLLNETVIDLTEGLQKRDFVYIKDVVEAYWKVTENIHSLEAYTEFEVGTGNSISIKDFVSAAKHISNSSSALNFGAIPTRKGEFVESKATIDSLKEVGWLPEYDYNKGLSDLLKNNL
ncbi:NAD-dependent epimerase/dehydratase family protein [Cytophaga aurantiaca]|uniref:NAD-dependent epimerase/dehydratase family protein n=1 Tax=Cytophaga aurantiaca TaxID=29530 RepID=UPI00039C4014|nr:NAD-dependent epimerase/dehydratase family protein [Cytophaga aurantiaca]